MSEADNKEIVRRWYEDGVNKRNIDLFEELFHQDVVFQSPSLGGGRGLREGRRYVDSVLAAFPDWQLIVHYLVAEGDRVVARLTATGHHKGEFMGIAPTDKHIKLDGIAALRIADGKITEFCDLADVYGLMVQLGAAPPPSQT